MTVLDVVCRMPEDALVTVVDKNGDILVDVDSCGRILAFKDIEKEVEDIVNRLVFKIEIGTVYNDIILSTSI
jgi:hypothetical protein